ncbi:hypothetical protein D3C75_1331280 [compost metagenome]
MLLGAQNYGRPQKVVPLLDEQDNPQGGERRFQVGKNNPAEHTNLAAPVDSCRLHHFIGNGTAILPHEEDAKSISQIG